VHLIFGYTATWRALLSPGAWSTMAMSFVVGRVQQGAA